MQTPVIAQMSDTDGSFCILKEDLMREKISPNKKGFKNKFSTILYTPQREIILERDFSNMLNARLDTSDTQQENCISWMLSL